MEERIKSIINNNIHVKQSLLHDPEFVNVLLNVVNEIVACYQNGGKILLCGNGGSAADAQHIAAELSGRFYFDRPSLPAEAIHVNSSYMTAVANDYTYEQVYARYISGAGNKGDILIGISTSGNSANIIHAFTAAKEKGMITVGLTGSTGGKMKDNVDFLITVPSDDTPRIQEAHILVGHIICELVESAMFPK